MVETRYEHVILGEDRVPIIAGTPTKITELIPDKIAYGWSPEELQFQHHHLKLGQIYSALAYYSDHQDELDEIIQRQLEHVRSNEEESPTNAACRKIESQKVHLFPNLNLNFHSNFCILQTTKTGECK